MQIEITFRPLEKWPGQPTADHRRQRSRFATKYRDTLALLDRELRHLKARAVVIQLDCDPREIRRDGLPRSDARTRGPGVVLSFDSPEDSLSFPCDHFTAWEDNLRAIALALEALRTVDRYHVTRNHEQYRGWSALPDYSRRPFTTPAAAAEWVQQEAGIVVGPEIRHCTPETKATIRRQAIARFHPDRNDGRDDKWQLWLQAAELLQIER